MNDSTLWHRRVADWRASGLSALAYSRKHQLSAPDLRRWGKSLAVVAVPRPPEGPVTLARVVRQSSPAAGPASPASFVVEVASARITVPPSFDRGALRAIIAVLESRGVAS